MKEYEIIKLTGVAWKLTNFKVYINVTTYIQDNTDPQQPMRARNEQVLDPRTFKVFFYHDKWNDDWAVGQGVIAFNTSEKTTGKCIENCHTSFSGYIGLSKADRGIDNNITGNLDTAIKASLSDFIKGANYPGLVQYAGSGPTTAKVVQCPQLTMYLAPDDMIPVEYQEGDAAAVLTNRETHYNVSFDAEVKTYWSCYRLKD